MGVNLCYSRAFYAQKGEAMARPHRYATTQVAKKVGVHRNTVTRWADGDLPAGFPIRVPLKTTPTGKVLLHPAEVAKLRAWALTATAGNRGAALAPVRQQIEAKRTAAAKQAEQERKAARRAALEADPKRRERLARAKARVLESQRDTRARYAALDTPDPSWTPLRVAMWVQFRKRAGLPTNFPPIQPPPPPLLQVLAVIVKARGSGTVEQALETLQSLPPAERQNVISRLRARYMAITEAAMRGDA